MSQFSSLVHLCLHFKTVSSELCLLRKDFSIHLFLLLEWRIKVLLISAFNVLTVWPKCLTIIWDLNRFNELQSFYSFMVLFIYLRNIKCFPWLRCESRAKLQSLKIFARLLIALQTCCDSKFLDELRARHRRSSVVQRLPWTVSACSLKIGWIEIIPCDPPCVFFFKQEDINAKKESSSGGNWERAEMWLCVSLPATTLAEWDISWDAEKRACHTFIATEELVKGQGKKKKRRAMGWN